MQIDDQKDDKENTTAIIDGNMGIVYGESSVILTWHTSDWVIDLSDLFHITTHYNYFTSYKIGDYSHAQIGNEGASKIMGI